MSIEYVESVGGYSIVVKLGLEQRSVVVKY